MLRWDPKGRRPLSTKKALHLVLKSEVAKGALSLSHFKNKQTIDGLVKHYSKKHGVQLYSYSNNGNHIHAVIRFKSVNAYKRFIKALTGHITYYLKQSYPELFKKIKKFWLYRPWPRIVEWGRDFKKALQYLAINQMEAMGMDRPKVTEDDILAFMSKRKKRRVEPPDFTQHELTGCRLTLFLESSKRGRGREWREVPEYLFSQRLKSAPTFGSQLDGSDGR